MFSRDHRLNPPVPHPAAFDGVKPSFMEWSEEIIVLLAVTGHQELIPPLSAATFSNDVIETIVMFKRILSGIMEDINWKTDDQLRKRQIELKFKLMNASTHVICSPKRFKML